MAQKSKYYSLDKILKEDALYNMIIGERSNGKTYAVENYALEKFCKKCEEQFAIVRRWGDDFKGARGSVMFDALVKNSLVEKYTGGEWNSISYRSSRWFLSKVDTELDTKILMQKPFAYGFSINAQEHYKSTSYPDITTVMFDEFITREMYLPDEFVSFTNILSTIIRDRENVKIFMLGNTVNKYNPYFEEMGLYNATNQKQGTIDVYNFGTSGLRIAVEYCNTAEENKKRKIEKKSNKYFAFNNPKLKMITSGAWEIDIYPHLPIKYKPMNIALTYFIKFKSNILQCEIIRIKDENRDTIFTYIHRKTTELKNYSDDIIYATEHSHLPNWRMYMSKPTDDIDRFIYSFFKNNKVFYQTNEVGEIVMNYFKWCEK